MKKKLLQNTDFFLSFDFKKFSGFQTKKAEWGSKGDMEPVIACVCGCVCYIYIYISVFVCVIMRDNIWQTSSTGDSLFNGGSELPLQLITMMNVQTVATSVWEQEQPLSPVQWIQMLRARRHADTSFNTVKCHCSGNASKWLNLCLRIK